MPFPVTSEVNKAYLLLTYFLPGSAYIETGAFVTHDNKKCLKNPTCLKTLKVVSQLSKWLNGPSKNFGSLASFYAETTLKGTFHPSLVFHENTLILSQNPAELDL